MPLMFSYNTSFHRTIQTTPHQLTYGLPARQPAFRQADLDTKFYGSKSVEEKLQRLDQARQIAAQHTEVATEASKYHHDLDAEPHQYRVGQLVLLQRHVPPVGKNAK